MWCCRSCHQLWDEIDQKWERCIIIFGMYIRYIHCHGFTNHLGYPYGLSISVNFFKCTYINTVCGYIIYKKYYMYLQLGKKETWYLYLHILYIHLLVFSPNKNHETICHSTMYYHGIFQESNLLWVVFHQYLPTRECLGMVYRRGSKPGEPWHGTNGRFHGWGLCCLVFLGVFVGKKQQAPGEYSWEFRCVARVFCWKGLVCGWVVC